MPEKVTMDGNEAAAHVAYTFSEIAAIYPITPSSPMAEHTDVWAANGRKNLWGQTVRLVEMQSEAGAIAAVHGALQTGALAVTFTSSQGLMLMVPVLHRISGERLPAVLHVASRTVGTHAMSIFGDHSDVMSCRNSGFAMLCTSSVQEILDLAGAAHACAVKSGVPFMHFFDGFRTSHEISRAEAMTQEQLASLLDNDALARFRAHAVNPEHPLLHSTVQNPDVYFQIREANEPFYAALPDTVEDCFRRINAMTGRDYHLFNYYGAPDAEHVAVAMGSVSGAAREAVDYLNARGHRVGFVQVHLFRPFSFRHFFAALPETVKSIAVLDRCKEMGSAGEPLYQDVCTAVVDAGRAVRVIGGRYGLSSKDTDPAQIAAVFENLESEHPVRSFTVGITDDVNLRSLPVRPLEGLGENVYAAKFWGLGGDGTVGANKNTVGIVTAATELYAQAYFEYDAKKSFGVTKSHLRFSEKPIRGSYYVKSADFVACHNQSYIDKYDIVSEIKPGGTFLLCCAWHGCELEAHLPSSVKRTLARRHISFYTIDAAAIAGELGLGSHTNTVLQAAFFALCGMIPAERAVGLMKDAARKTYFAKGDEVVAKNIAAIERGASGVVKIDVPEAWADLEPEDNTPDPTLPEAVRRLLIPINAQKGDDLPVSAFRGYEDGAIEPGLTAYEKRGIALSVPSWQAEKCVQCNRCSLVCPHAAIRPYLLSEGERESAPAGFESVPAKGAAAKGLFYALSVSHFDCTGCGGCASVCPAGALEMKPAVLTQEKEAAWDYGLTVSDKGDVFDPWTVKGSQLRRPLLEFSAACAGCGETPYAKLLTQLFGDRVYWANATGCSQAWGAPMPGIPYTVNERGFGPAWSNSLFENNAEFSLGMLLSVRQQREWVKERVRELAETAARPETAAACRVWLDGYDDAERSRRASDDLIAELEREDTPAARQILARRDQLAKKTFWMFGGDGWAYDIGFGGLDHVVAQGENINVFVIDTEVYSNTGGQSSKATPIGAVAQFAASGKKSRKKDLGAMLMTYGSVYVAQVAMGADPAQLLRALREAESYDGPSVVIAYTPCTSHGIRLGMGRAQEEMRRAVRSGYWLLYRYDPRREHPLTLDSREPDMDYTDFLDGETRYASLRRTFPENAERLFAEGAEGARERLEHYKKLEGC